MLPLCRLAKDGERGMEWPKPIWDKRLEYLKILGTKQSKRLFEIEERNKEKREYKREWLKRQKTPLGHWREQFKNAAASPAK